MDKTQFLKSRNAKKKIIVAAAAFLACCLVLYILVIQDSSLNIYKKHRIKTDAAAYISKNYPDFKTSDIDVDYDRELNFYVAECTSDNETIILQYSPTLAMELDCYFDSVYTSAALKYQEDTEKSIAKALKDKKIECSLVSVYLTLNSADKNNIVFNGGKITNEKIDCYVEYNHTEDKALMTKTEFAQLAKNVAACVYDTMDDDISIETLEIKYMVSGKKYFAVNWSPRMEKMTVQALSKEIK